MRLTLEQLKAKSDEEIKTMWWRGEFPFENAACGHCLIHHWELATGGALCKEHPELVAHISGIVETCTYDPSEWRKRFEELYALRLFFDSIYRDADRTLPSLPEATVEESAALAGKR